MIFRDLKIKQDGYQCPDNFISHTETWTSLGETALCPRILVAFVMPDCSLPAPCNGVNYSLILYIWFVTFSILKILGLNYTTQWKQLENKTKTHHMWFANQNPVKQNWILHSHGFLSIVKRKCMLRSTISVNCWKIFILV